MNHRPFEDWLLADQPLDAQQQRDLQNHLRDCVSCTAIAEANMALRAVRMISPQPGFSERFGALLEKRREQLRLRQILGTVVLVLAGVGLVLVLAGPFLAEAITSPASWITAMVGYLLFVITSFRVLSEVTGILVRVLPNVLTPGGWFAGVLTFAGLAFFWTFSIRRARHVPQGV